MDGELTVSVRAVICDLGGVVVRVDADQVRRRWAERSRLPDPLVYDAFTDEVYEALERGDVSEHDYLAHIRERLRLDATDAQLTADFNGLFLGIDTAVLAVLADARDRGVLLVALTNTNRLHHPVWSQRYADELQVFDAIHCSHDLGARKPEPIAYAGVLAAHDLAPHEAVFVDDRLDNVEAARHVGLHAIHFTDAASLVEHLGHIPWRH